MYDEILLLHHNLNREVLRYLYACSKKNLNTQSLIFEFK